jgi:hypothetical protein
VQGQSQALDPPNSHNSPIQGPYPTGKVPMRETSHGRFEPLAKEEESYAYSFGLGGILLSPRSKVHWKAQERG